MKEIVVVDGYNIIGAWEELRKLKEIDMAEARDRLIELMADYQGYTGTRVIIVFDAYEVPGLENKQQKFAVEVIFTKEKETADERIERLVGELINVETQVYVATSDYVEQRVIFGKGALRKSARELFLDIQEVDEQIDYNLKQIKKNHIVSKINFKPDILEEFERMRRRKD